jgi:ribonuclease HII
MPKVTGSITNEVRVGSAKEKVEKPALAARFKEDSLLEIGLDEAGRGSFWGPITAGATLLPPESEWTADQRRILSTVRDSKKISPKKREKLAEEIKVHLPFHAIGMVHADEINVNGITWANREAFRRAYAQLGAKTETHRLLVDGVLSVDTWGGEQEVIVEGDNTYMAIATSSILAKVAHDHWIRDYCEEHPECDERYHLLSSKGYGTAKHREGIQLYGAHELHREIYIQRWLPGSKPAINNAVNNTTTNASNKKNKDKCLIRFTDGECDDGSCADCGETCVGSCACRLGSCVGSCAGCGDGSRLDGGGSCVGRLGSS